MTPNDFDTFEKALDILDDNCMELWRGTLQNKAWIIALYGSVVHMIQKETGKTREQVTEGLSDMQERAYQKLLLRVEKINPSVAAQLDNRKIEGLD